MPFVHTRTRYGTIRRDFVDVPKMPVVVYPNGWVQVVRRDGLGYRMGNRRFDALFDVEAFIESEGNGGELFYVPVKTPFSEMRGLHSSRKP